eukprot:2036769-Pyramimonas_sp.AAC.1
MAGDGTEWSPSQDLAKMATPALSPPCGPGTAASQMDFQPARIAEAEARSIDSGSLRRCSWQRMM